MPEHKLRYDGEGEQINCNCCDYPAPLREYYCSTHEMRLLCEVCASTFLSEIAVGRAGEKALAESIGWIANHILAKLNDIAEKLGAD